MTRVTVDALALMIQLYAKELPAVWVQDEVEVDTVEKLPALLVTVTSGQMVSNGSPRLGWVYEVAVTIYCAGKEEAGDLADLVYVTTHHFHDQQASVSGLGYISSVDDISMPVKADVTDLKGTRVYQYVGAFAVTMRPLSN